MSSFYLEAPFDMEKIMIIIKGKDKTSEIEWISTIENSDRINIYYVDGKKAFSTSREVIEIYDNPVREETCNNVIYIDGFPVYKPQYILHFGNKLRVCYGKQKYMTTDGKHLKIVSTALKDQNSKEVFSYFRKITQCMEPKRDEKYEKSFLQREMEKITFVHPDSVLAAYLSKGEIRHESMETPATIFPFSFNLSQKEALEKALTHSVSVIQGPPGTGKTQTILNILANLISLQKKSVAVVSNNNDAVKNVREKLEKEEYGFLNASLGNKKNREGFFKNPPAVNIPVEWNAVVPYTVQQLLNKAEKLEKSIITLQYKDREKKKLEQELREWKLEQEHFESYFQKHGIKEDLKLPLFCRKTDKIMSFLAETAINEKLLDSKKIIYKLKLLFKYGVLDTDRLKGDEIDVVISLQRKYYQLQISQIQSQIRGLERQLKGYSFEGRMAEYKWYSELIFKKILYNKYSKCKDDQFGIKDYKARFNRFLEKYPIILSSTYALRNSIPENYLLDYVIIDESSQVDLITGIMVLSCCKNVIIVGDDKQLPQIVETDIEERLGKCPFGEAYDYFKESILTSVLKLYGASVPCTTLREHYRCQPQIIEFCNKQFYDGKLITYTESETEDTPLILYKTAPGNHMRILTYGKGSKLYNQRELDVVVEEVIKNPQLSDKEDIGFVTPFREQVKKAEQIVDDTVQCDTVHKYQGREKKVMILSTVLDETYAAKKRLAFVDNPQLINVAVSRASSQLVVVTNGDFFENNGENVSALLRYMQYSTLDENVIESQIVSVFDLLYKKYSEKLLPIMQKMNREAKWKSEEAVRVLLEEILKHPNYSQCIYASQVLIKNLIGKEECLTADEQKYVDNRASLDFVIYRKMDMSCVMAIEVNGFAFHENNPKQTLKDQMKKSIMEKNGLKLLSLKTNGSGERQKIEKQLDEVLGGKFKK